MQRQQIERRTHDHRDRTSDELEATPVETVLHDDLARELDEVLDEIDDLLEENAEEFVKAYVQKGGE
jgi:ubiquitin-like protein Pup